MLSLKFTALAIPTSLRSRGLAGPLLQLPARSYATGSQSSAASKRRQVTVANDDGRVQWSELSGREKAARTTQQSFNLAIILVGVVAMSGAAYFVYSDVFSPNSKTVLFNRAVQRITKDSQVVEVLGPAKKIKAFGEPNNNKWSSTKPIVSRFTKDRLGVEHMHMHFNLEGPLNSGVARVHMKKAPRESRYEYSMLAVDVKGYQRISLINEEAKTLNPKSSGKMFGVKWW